MSTAYTKPLLKGLLNGNSALHAVVPAGKTWVLRDISGLLFCGTPSSHFVVIDVGGVQLAIILFTTAGYINYHWQGRIAIASGDSLNLTNTSVDQQSVYVTGYEFS